MVGLAAILTLWALASSVLRWTPQQMGLMPDGDGCGATTRRGCSQHSPGLSLRSDPGFQPGERREGGGGARILVQTRRSFAAVLLTMITRTAGLMPVA